jgi:hypothetical protein
MHAVYGDASIANTLAYGPGTVNLARPSAESYVGAQFTTQCQVAELAANNLGVISSHTARTTPDPTL